MYNFLTPILTVVFCAKRALRPKATCFFIFQLIGGFGFSYYRRLTSVGSLEQLLDCHVSKHQSFGLEVVVEKKSYTFSQYMERGHLGYYSVQDFLVWLLVKMFSSANYNLLILIGGILLNPRGSYLRLTSYHLLNF